MMALHGTLVCDSGALTKLGSFFPLVRLLKL